MNFDQSLSLAGKVAITTGSGKTTGIGASIALTLARAGAKVVINFVSDSTGPEAERVVKGIEAVAGAGAAAMVQADIGSIEGAKKLVQESLSKLQVDKIDIIVNNAAWSKPGAAIQFKPEDLHKCFAVMVFGPLYLLQAALPYMSKGGRVINIGSIASKLGLPGTGIYASAKAAMDSLTFTLASELGRNGPGVTINTLMPGPIPTEGVPAHPDIEAAHIRMRAQTRAEDRLGHADDIADATLLLASEKSRWITGQVLSASGGITGG